MARLLGAAVVILALVLSGCGESTPPSVTQVRMDPVIVPSLDVLVRNSPQIYIGTVVTRGGIVNMARDVDDHSKPDNHIFHLGQTYGVAVERYLTERGPEMLYGVQLEGVLSVEDGNVPAELSPSMVAQARAQFSEYTPMRIGQRYLFFTRPIEGFDPSSNLVATAAGHPWRFTLPVDGQAQPDTFWPEARSVIPAMPSADLVRIVEQLIAGDGAESRETPVPVAPTPPSVDPTGSLVDPIIVGSLEQLVDVSPFIFIGTVIAPGEIVNLARDVTNHSQPDSQRFHLGQVYEVSVEGYLKGQGPSVLPVVQMEGRSASGDRPATPPTTQAEIAAMKAQFGAIPLVAGQRYVFFVRPLEDFDAGREYMATSYGHPWWFTLPVDGMAEAGSQYPEAVAAFPPETASAFVTRIQELVENEH